MPKGTAATERAKGGVKGWRQRPKRAVWRRDAERREAVPQAARGGRAKRGQRREGRHPTGETAQTARKRPKRYIYILGALPTVENCLCRRSRCWLLGGRHKTGK
jgi:hypothetical protein